MGPGLSLLRESGGKAAALLKLRVSYLIAELRGFHRQERTVYSGH
jgi:hypothetical protein